MVLRVQDALSSECLPVTGRIRSYLRPERELTFGGCSLVREFEEPSNGRKQMTVFVAGALPDLASSWDLIHWDTVRIEVKRLQVSEFARLRMRIAKAVTEQRWNKVKALQWLLTHSFAAKLLVVRRVSSNKGAKTPGIDNVVVKKWIQEHIGKMSNLTITQKETAWEWIAPLLNVKTGQGSVTTIS